MIWSSIDTERNRTLACTFKTRSQTDTIGVSLMTHNIKGLIYCLAGEILVTIDSAPCCCFYLSWSFFNYPLLLCFAHLTPLHAYILSISPNISNQYDAPVIENFSIQNIVKKKKDIKSPRALCSVDLSRRWLALFVVNFLY